MHAARIPRFGPLQAGLIAALLGLAGVAWLIVEHRMAGMDAGPGTDPGTLGFYTLSWVVMMAGMMFPSIVPMVLVFSVIQRGRVARGAVARGVSTNLFTAGYLISWTIAGLVAYGAFVGVRSLSLGALRWSHQGRYVAGAVLLLAAIYQLTPAKDACLKRCRGPLDFVLGHWREGELGALRMGAQHGAWCVGCCWALMAALFALGLMSITWMIIIAAAIAAEKLLPAPATVNRVIAVVLAALGVTLMASPASVPALVLPDSPQAQQAMRSMHGTGGAMGTHSMKAMPSRRGMGSSSTGAGASPTKSMSMPARPDKSASSPGAGASMNGKHMPAKGAGG
jgi:predicted metal-binding membrane protein